MIKRLFAGLLLATCSMGFAVGITEYQLDNGLTIIVQEDHRAPVAVFQIWYRVGASYEHNGTTGVSHALEHMMFKGTPKYPDGEFSRLIANAGGSENAATSKDFTYYFQSMPVSNIELSFKLEADRMRNLLLKPEEFEKERKVVIEERRMRTDDNPQMLTFERFFAAAYIASPYHQPTIGWMDDLKHLTLDDLAKWYKKWYAPNNATIVVAGDVLPKQMLALSKKYFADIPKSNLPDVKTKRSLSPLGIRTLEVHANAKVPWIIMGYNVPVINTEKTKTWEPYALAVASAVLDGGKSARLSKNLIRKQRVASSVGAGYSPFDRLDTLFVLEATPTPKTDIHTVQKALLGEVKKLQTSLVTNKELERIKTQITADEVFAKDSMMYQAMKLGALQSVGISWKTWPEYINRIKAVTAEQVREVARKYFKEERLTVAILKPTEDKKEA